MQRFASATTQTLRRTITRPTDAFSRSRTETLTRHLSTRALALPRPTELAALILTSPMSLQAHTGAFSQVHYDLNPETIYAISSGYGKCAVTIIRISGTYASKVLRTLTRDTLPKPRYASLRNLYDPKTGEVLDHSIVLWFPGKNSFTGEDSCELHLHGGLAVVNAVLMALAKMDGCRHAEAGEFTKRAFLNGKLDLTEVEGLADLIHAETEAQRKQALRQMDGALSQMYQEWRETLVKCLANVEAYIDFSEDQNIEDNAIDQVLAQVEVLVHKVMVHLEDNRRGERLRNGVRLAIIGEPNVGKSSILNKLCQRDAAIVSPIAGTTRDIVETNLDIGGFPVIVSDTAGLRKSQDPIEKEGVRRALKRANESDLKILVIDAQKAFEIGTKLSSFVEKYLKELGVEHSSDDLMMILFNKVDLLNSTGFMNLTFDLPCSFISCETDEGLTDFLSSIEDNVRELCANPSDANPSLTQARHRALLEQLLSSLETFLEMRKFDIVLAAEELRQAQRFLGKVTGKITTEEILDVIFRDFCIGK